MILKDQITDIFVQIDDFCKEFAAEIKQMKQRSLDSNKKRRNRVSHVYQVNIIIYTSANKGAPV